MKNHVKNLRVRPWILLRLLSMLIDSRHDVFDGKSNAVQLKAKNNCKKMHAEYPETKPHVPELERKGVIPVSVLKLINTRETIEKSILQSKNATPGPSSYALDEFLDQPRPAAVVLDRTTT